MLGVTAAIARAAAIEEPSLPPTDPPPSEVGEPFADGTLWADGTGWSEAV